MNPWSRLTAQAKVSGVLWPLIVFGWAMAFLCGLIVHAPVITQTRTVHLTPTQAVSRMSTRAIVAALGQPDQQQVQNGVTCAVWNSRQMEVCYR